MKPSDKKLLTYFITCLAVAAMGYFFLTHRPLRHHAKQQFFRMSTMIEVTVATDQSDGALKPLWQSIDSLLEYWSDHYSQKGDKSDVRVLNNREASSVPVSPELGRMVADGLAYGDSTGGMFDVTIFPVKELWGLGENSTIHKVPSSAELSAALRRVNYHKVRVSTLFDTIRFADSSTAIDAGGFAKGYALIQTAQILDRSGFHDYLVAAGDIVGRGRRKDGTRWCIGIQNPRTDKLLATVTFDTGAVFTSGDYENFWMDGDRRIHHIFNPRTGYSCTRNQSVTIRSDSPIQAKYLSTGLFSFSADSIISYVKQRGLDCVVVDSTGRVFVSPGWKDRVTLTK